MTRVALAVPAVLLVAALSGCTAVDPGSVDPPSSPVMESPSVPTTESAPTGDPEPGALWEGATLDDLQRTIREENAGLKEFIEEQHGITLDDVEIVRIVDRFEGPRVWSECLREFGFEARPTSDGDGLQYSEALLEQQADLARANWTCWSQYPVDPRQIELLPADKSGDLYSFLVSVSKPCLEDLGYVISEPPSQPVWEEQYRSDRGGQWDPFAEAQRAISAQRLAVEEDDRLMQEITDTCKRYPDDLYPAIPDR